MTRLELLAALARHVLATRLPHPTRVAIDGCSAAGKTTFADELAETLAAQTKRPIIRVGLDHFKRARPLRTAYPQDARETRRRVRRSWWTTPTSTPPSLSIEGL